MSEPSIGPVPTEAAVREAPVPDRSSGSRAVLGAGWRVVRADPTLWLLGALSFSVRGGVAALLLPILWIPTPALMSVFLAPYITTSGLSADAAPVLAVTGTAAIVLLLLAVVLAAVADLAAFERISGAEASADLRHGRRPVAVAGRGRTATLARLIALNLIGLVPIVALLVPLAARINAVVVDELQLPTSLDTPFLVTVLQRVSGPLVACVFVVVLVDLVVTLASRELLAVRFGLRSREALGGVPAALGAGIDRLARHPLRTAIVWAVGWSITIGLLVLVGAALGEAWSILRSSLFADVPADGSSAALLAFVRQFGALVLFGATWVAGITSCAIGSSLRGALWTLHALD